MTLLTPGVRFIGGYFATSIVPLAGAFALQHALAHFADLLIPTWLLLTIAFISFPVISAFTIITKEIKDRRDAAAVGARLAPRAEGVYPGNYDILTTMLNNWKFGYPGMLTLLILVMTIIGCYDEGDGLWDILETKGPTFNMRIFWDDLVFTSHPEHLKLILATDFNNFVKGNRFRNSMRSVLGTGVFNSDGDMWKFHRSITRPVFTRDRISDFNLFDRHTEAVISALKSRLRQNQPVDFQDLMSRFTLDTATEFLFGNCVHSLATGLPYPHNVSEGGLFLGRDEVNTPLSKNTTDFAKAFADVQEMIANRERLGWTWPLAEILKDKTEEPMKVVNGYIEPIVQEALERQRLLGNTASSVDRDGWEKRAKEKEFREDETLLDHLVSLTDDAVVIKDETLNIMIAGRDTTAATLTFAIYLLSMHPHLANRLREEVLNKVGSSRRPTYDDIREMKYLRAVINETLRLFPSVPFNIREAVKATTWPSPDPTQPPIFLPAGTKIPYSVLIMQRRKDLWGPDADEFDPDRFLDERLKKYLINNSFIFLPFNAGPRICLGQQFAYNEMSFMLIRLLQNFSSFSLDLGAWEPEMRPPADWAGQPGRKGTEKMRPRMHLTMYSSGGMWIRMTEAETDERT
ncbi:cytochrome P450 [Pluteus cervinus]|uniref:Cytochrome P450 n=1 Tax=Pluteus cervinus TaxID=181527 RepID=A0ACD3B3U0_9AGAR|nr:cytochrome P450 [Pluteus cervinus]